MQTNLETLAATEAESRTPRRMSRTMLNLILDITLLISILFIIWTTGMLRAVFPAPTAAEGWTLWGLSLDQWTNIQFYATVSSPS